MNSLSSISRFLIFLGCGLIVSRAEIDFSSKEEWSGRSAQKESFSDVKTPAGEDVVSWTWSKGEGDALPTFSFSRAQPLAMQGDVVTFWLRVNKPLQRLDVVLNDVHGIGAERSVAEILGVKRIEAGRWYHVVWPFRLQPGWVRYESNKMDWNKMIGATLYTWNDQWTNGEVTVELSPMRVLSFDELDRFFTQYPEFAGGDRAIAWRILTDETSGRMMEDYHRRRVEQAILKLRAQYPPPAFVKSQNDIRRRLAETYMMPKNEGVPSSILIRTEQVDGIAVELELLKIREGVYSTAEIYLPSREGNLSLVDGKHPVVLMLPGHGDVDFSGSVQDRCLSFAKHGYLTMFVEPVGQDELDDDLEYCEDLDSQSAAFLLPTGQSLLGNIMSNHLAELSYLLHRDDVDANRVVVTGVSMGGTHSVWLSAIDLRISVSIPDAVAACYTAPFSSHHVGLCDIMVGAYRVADQEMMYSLIAPRPLLEIIPNVQAPLTEEGIERVAAGQATIEEAEKKYARSDAQIEELHQYVHAVYNSLDAPQRYLNVVVDGPHDYTKEMREKALGFLDWVWQGYQGQPLQPTTEGILISIRDRAQAMAVFKFWPDGKRPKEILGPTAYTQREISRAISQLPPPPQNISDWKREKNDRESQVLNCLGVNLDSANATLKFIGKLHAEHGALQKWIVTPEPGIKVPMLLFAPDDGVKPDGRLVVLLHPGGMTRISAEERQKLTAGGAWVVCADLRGTGETRYAGEVGTYLGMHDYDVSCMALKLGDTLAGYWTRDLLAVVHAARTIVGPEVKISVRAERESGFAAILAAIHCEEISGVETTGLLASYYSAQGYGLPYVYGADRALGGYGSMVPCIPSILKYADVTHLAAMIAPRPLVIQQPLWASDKPLSQKEIDDTFSVCRQIYMLYGAVDQFTATTETTK